MLATSIVAYLIVLQFLFFRLRREHPAQYQELGAPSFLNNSRSNSARVVRYLLDKDYLDLPDLRTNQLGKRARQLFLFGSGVFGVALVGFGVLAATF